MPGSKIKIGPDTYRLRWDGVPHPDGRRRQLSETFRGTERQADRRLNRLTAEAAQGVQPDTKMTVGELLDRWRRDVALPRVQTTTAATYDWAIERHIRPHVGGIRLVALGAMQVQELQARLLRQGLAPGSVALIRSVLTAALHQAVLWGLIPRNPCGGVPAPESQRQKRERQRRQAEAILTPDQLVTLLEHLEGDPLRVAVLLGAGAALRTGEAVGLRWQDVDAARRQLHVRQTLKKDGTYGVPKGGEPRTILLSPELAEALTSLRAAQDAAARERHDAGLPYVDSGLVFQQPHGAGYSDDAFRYWWYRALTRAGLPRVKWHSLRHLSISLLVESGIDLKTIQTRVGHADPGLTLRVYTHPQPAAQERAAGVLDTVLRRAGAVRIDRQEPPESTAP